MTLDTAINLLASHIVTGDLKMITVFLFSFICKERKCRFLSPVDFT